MMQCLMAPCLPRASQGGYLYPQDLSASLPQIHQARVRLNTLPVEPGSVAAAAAAAGKTCPRAAGELAAVAGEVAAAAAVAAA